MATLTSHPYGEDPGQVAVDLLLAAFRSVSNVQARNDNDTEVLGEVQGHLNEAYKLIRLIHPEVCI